MNIVRLLLVVLLAACALFWGDISTPARAAGTGLGFLALLALIFFGDFRLQGSANAPRVLLGSAGCLLGLAIARLLSSQVLAPFLDPLGWTGLVPPLGIVLTILLGYFGILVGRASAAGLPLGRTDAARGEGRRIYLVDADALIDGRIVRLSASPLLDGEIVVARSSVEGLEAMTTSKDSILRFRGQRGLENLKALGEGRGVRLTIQEIDARPGQEDHGLIKFAREKGARLVSHREEMRRLAEKNELSLLDFNEVASLLSPEVITGDELVVKLVKPGKEADQAVGYLNDGNMVVVESARAEIGRTVRVAVTGIHQTKAGMLVFAQLKKQGGG